MSLIEITEVTPEAKLSGCGDGITNGCSEKINRKLIRPQIPSSRKFATRPPPPNQNKETKCKLKKAINELATNPNITRRKSLTLAEITPTRNINRKMDGSSSVPSSVQRIGKGYLVPTAPFKKEDARRRVYQLLLLNAWRRGRNQVATLSESLQTVKTQNGKLELQITALEELRQAECNKREESVAQSLSLQKHANEVLKENEALRKENIELENEVRILEEAVQQKEIECQNLLNDWMTARYDLKNTENQLNIEREKLKKIDKEKFAILDQLFLKERDVSQINEQMNEIQVKLLNTELRLKESLSNNFAYENDKKELMVTLNNELILHEELRFKLQESEIAKEKLGLKVTTLQKLTNINKGTIKKLREDNDALKKNVAEITAAFEEERQKPWWKNAGELAMVPLNVLQNAAYIMLPAITTTKTTTTTSTTDIHTLVY